MGVCVRMREYRGRCVWRGGFSGEACGTDGVCHLTKGVHTTQRERVQTYGEYHV